jgi:hypothetical protein
VIAAIHANSLSPASMIIVIVLAGDGSAQRDRFLDGAMMHSFCSVLCLLCNAAITGADES